MRYYFEGWYYKQQNDEKTLAFIPGISGDSAFIQVVTENNSFYFSFNISDYQKIIVSNEQALQIGNNYFSSSCIKINLKNMDVSISGELKFSNPVGIQGDIMGFFRFFPMECRHGIISMKHSVSGEIVLNGEKISFDKGIGYIETDSGISFPKSYSWIHSNDFDIDCSITAAIAEIPFAGFHFWGCICVVLLKGKEYRLATYKGAKIIRCEKGIMEIKQRKYNLIIKAEQKNPQDLPAPKFGLMSRIIKESASCSAEFLFTKNGKEIFLGTSKHASYEFVT